MAIRIADHPVSPFCLGTINWGTTLTGDALDRLYDTFRAAGGNFFDTAHVYACWLPNGHGSSERALGDVVRRHGDTGRVLIATKGGHPPMKDYPHAEAYLSPDAITTDVADSLQRLGVDTVGLYYLHRDDPRVPVGEIMDTLDAHVRAGRVRAIGASNWTTDRIEAANNYARANGRAAFVANQPKLSLAVAKPSNDPTVPRFGPEDFAWHAGQSVVVCPYSPTANGFFATGGTKGSGGWEAGVSTARLRVAGRLAAEIGATSNQIALAWLLHQPFPVVPILGTTDEDHLNDAMGASDVRLSVVHMTALTATAA